MKHATECGGSSANRYLQCTAASDLISKLPKKPTNAAALQGSALHYVMEQCLIEGEKPESFIGDEIQLDEADAEGNPIVIEITDEMVALKVIPALKFFDEHLGEAEFWVEQKVQFDQDKLPGFWGTADILFNDPKIGWGVLDWKFGKTPVRASSVQLGFYLAAAKTSTWFGKDASKFTAIVVQPIDGKVDTNFHTYRRGELELLEESLLKAYLQHQEMRAIGPEALKDLRWFDTGSACTWCEAKLVCPKKRDIAVLTIKPLSDAHKALVKTQPMKKTTAQVMPDQDIVQTYLDAVEAAKWCNQVTDYVKAEFAAGRPIRGLEQVEISVVREWADEKKAKAFARRRGLKNADFSLPAPMITVSALEALIDSKVPDHFVKCKKRYSIIGSKKLPDNLDKISEIL